MQFSSNYLATVSVYSLMLHKQTSHYQIAISHTLNICVLFHDQIMRINKSMNILSNVYASKLIYICDWILENQPNCQTWPIPFYWPS